ncbi:MAG: DUF2788 domain-containing protein [Formosimonas sp.]|jgi:uncharacterized membrane protein
MTEAQLSDMMMYVGVGGLILLMVFIVLNLARQSKAGRYGTMVLLLALILGVVGFLLKSVMMWFIER